MSKVMQNLVFLVGPSEVAWSTPMRAGNMCLNRFCIDEDAAFELSGVKYLKSHDHLKSHDRKMKGQEFLFLQHTFLLT